MKSKEERPVFIDLRTDFGFKRCFGDERVMKRFLNIIIGKEYGHIENLVFENVECVKPRENQRGVTFDLRCTLDNGDDVIVEMQNYGHPFFLTRANYYLYNLMDKHIEKGVVWSERNRDIPHLIGVFILGVPMKELTDVITQTAECNLSSGKVIWDRMRKYFISLPNFTFEEKEEPSDEQIWIQTIKNLGNMVSFDQKLYNRADDELKALIDKARISALSDEEYARYERELKILSDEGTAEKYGYNRGLEEGFERGVKQGLEQGLEQGVKQGLEQGVKQGLEQGAKQTAKIMKEKGLDTELIAQITKLTVTEIEAL